MSGDLRVRFWGVRGSTPSSEPESLGFGGHTACVEIRYGAAPPVILDSGSGARLLGRALASENGAQEGYATFLISHLHWDHIQGLPFFGPLYSSCWNLDFCSPLPAGELERALDSQMSRPYFSAGAAVRARRTYAQIPREGMQIGDLAVRSFPLRHPDGCAGYRIDAPDASVVYATDHEHGDPEADRILVEAARNATVLVCDAQYTPEEYPNRVGWGHSTWLAAMQTAREARVGRLILFHHDPDRSDESLRKIESMAAREFPNTTAARERWEIRL